MAITVRRIFAGCLAAGIALGSTITFAPAATAQECGYRKEGNTHVFMNCTNEFLWVKQVRKVLKDSHLCASPNRPVKVNPDGVTERLEADPGHIDRYSDSKCNRT